MFLSSPIPPLPHLSVLQSSSPISLTSSLSYLVSNSIWELLVPFCSLSKFSIVSSFQELSQRYCQLGSFFPNSLCPHCSSPLASFILPLQNERGNDKANWELSSYHIPCCPLTVDILTTALWQNKHSQLFCGVTVMPKQQREHSMSCTGRIHWDSYTLILGLIPDTKAECTKCLLSNPKHQITVTQHQVYVKVHLVVIDCIYLWRSTDRCYQNVLLRLLSSFEDVQQQWFHNFSGPHPHVWLPSWHILGRGIFPIK